MSQFMRLLRRDEGVEAVEFALVVPVLLMLIAGIVNLGFAFNAATVVTTAARDAARAASLGAQSASAVIGAARTDLVSLPGGATTPVTVTCQRTGSTCDFTAVATSTSFPIMGDTVTVTVSYVNRWPIPIVLVGQTTITRSSQMRIE